MVAPPPPPKLSYKGRKEREEEERARRELEEAQGRIEEAARTKVAAEEAAWKGGALPAPRPAAPARAATPAAGARPAQPAARARPAEAARAVPAEPTMREPKKGAPALASVQALQYAESPKMLEMMVGEEAPAAKEAEPARPPARPRRPPRPPKSPDMRPVWAGFVLVGVGLTQAFWGLYAMVHAHEASAGLYTDIARWAAFSAGFSALVLGAFAVRGGMWSFRKERYDIVKWGAICGTICMWALWVPWAFGLLALLIIHRARDEYYPYYDPARDAPGWVRPPPRPAEGLETVEVAEGEQADGGETAKPAAEPQSS
jgi:hypothetical protein